MRLTVVQAILLLASSSLLATSGCSGTTSETAQTSCTDSIKNGTETDVDCGGSCGPCTDRRACMHGTDCASGTCTNNVCAGPTGSACTDGAQNGGETDTDCGGSCNACTDGKRCSVEADCQSAFCQEGTCRSRPSCVDGAQNGDETDTDCGGGCDPCALGKHCGVAADCLSGICPGGVCLAPADCSDRQKNGDETDVDCGGGCPACANGQSCLLGTDCRSGSCPNGFCEAAAGDCSDGARNGDESDVDCGGACCPCTDGRGCLSGQDCASSVCRDGTCQAPSCADGVKNGQECGVDCGGSCPAPCAIQTLILDVFDGASICSNGCTRTVEQGQLQAGSWSPLGGDSRLVYDFNQQVDCGRLTVEVDNFSPYEQFVPHDNNGIYTEFLSLFDGLEDLPQDRFDHNSDYSQIDVVYPPGCFDCVTAPGLADCDCCVADLADCPPGHCRDEDKCAQPNYTKFKPNAGLLTACDWDSGRYCDGLQHGQTHYRIELTWTPQSLSMRVNDVDMTYYAYPVYPNGSCTFTCRPKTPQLRYLYVGRPRMDWAGFLVGPRYTRVQLETSP